MREALAQMKKPTGCLEAFYTLCLMAVAWYVLNRLWAPIFIEADYHDRPDRRLQAWFFIRHNFLMWSFLLAYFGARFLVFRWMTSQTLRPIACVLVASGVWQVYHAYDFMYDALPRVEGFASRDLGYRLELLMERRAKQASASRSASSEELQSE